MTDQAVAQSFSQLGQDVWVYQTLQQKTNGYFVELGAGDGVGLSNTYALERHFAWGGICIECSPQYSSLCRNRRCVCDSSCVSDKDGETVTFLQDHKYGDHNHFSGIKSLINCHEPQGSEYQLQTKTLASVLRQHSAPKLMDYLSLDTEGSEYAILSVFPHHEYRFRCVTVEHNFVEKVREKIRSLMESNGYTRVEQRQWDDFYIDSTSGT
jgi:hypothetical protein